MFQQLLVMSALVVAGTIWTALARAMRDRQAQQLTVIAHQGECSDARIVGIQRPCMFDQCTRLYFEFTPRGASRAICGCHVDRRPYKDIAPILPTPGTRVHVHYLPHEPQRAVIRKLV